MPLTRARTSTSREPAVRPVYSRSSGSAPRLTVTAATSGGGGVIFAAGSCPQAVIIVVANAVNSTCAFGENDRSKLVIRRSLSFARARRAQRSPSRVFSGRGLDKRLVRESKQLGNGLLALLGRECRELPDLGHQQAVRRQHDDR